MIPTHPDPYLYEEWGYKKKGGGGGTGRGVNCQRVRLGTNNLVIDFSKNGE